MMPAALAIPTPPPRHQDSVIVPFHAPIPPEDVPRLEQIAGDLLDWTSHCRTFSGIDTLRMRTQPAQIARAFEVALACMTESGDVEPDWAAATSYPIEHIQGWAALNRPGVLVGALEHELAGEWFLTHGGPFTRPDKDIHGGRLPPRSPAPPSGEWIVSATARLFSDLSPAEQAIEREEQAEMRQRNADEAPDRATPVRQLPISPAEAQASAAGWAKLTPSQKSELRQVLAAQETHTVMTSPKQELIIGLIERLRADPPAPAFDWGDRVPRGDVTYLGANGGMGKSTLGLMLAVCAAAGRNFLGLPTRHQIAGFYSAEDNENILLHRLCKICRAEGIDPAELEGRLHLLDMTDAEDPELFRDGRATPRLDWLRQQVQTLGVKLLIVDGASDVFDDNEIVRARVRKFMRLLRGLGCTVILLAHIDKAAARAGGGDQNYSGSTAWNNSARSRLAMTPNTDGTVELVHEKNNYGPKQPPLRLTWSGGVPVLAGGGGAATGEDPTGALLALIHEFNTRGEYISTTTNSTANAFRMLSKEPSFPRQLSRADVFYQLRQAERAGYISNFEYKTRDRKARKRWELTEAGKTRIAPSAAPSVEG